MVAATAARSWSSRWLRPEVYPIIVAISGACSVCVFQCVRHLTQSPDVSMAKSDRMMGVKEEKRFFKDGERFREHGVRRTVRHSSPHIFSTLNAKMGGASLPLVQRP